jgi:hypothetical protein
MTTCSETLQAATPVEPGLFHMLFSHSWYVYYGQYPEGVGDMFGYWVESCLLGSVDIFSRRMPGFRLVVSPTQT